MQETGCAKHSTLDVLWRSKKSNGYPLPSPLYVPLQRNSPWPHPCLAVKGYWSILGSVIIGSLTFLQIMASAAVSSFTPALSENTAVRWNTVKADGLLRVLNIQVMPSSRYIGSKGELIRSLDSPLPILYRYLYYSKLFSENNSQNSKNSTTKFG